MARPTALVFQTHFFDRGLARVSDRLRRECPAHFTCLVLMHVPPGTPKPRRLEAVPHHFVTTPEIRALDYPGKNGDQDWTGEGWHLWNGGHCDLIPLHFFNAYPAFERYWVVEYDVRFTGHWGRFFGAFEESEADLLSTSIRRRRDNPAWCNWHSVRGPVPAAAIEPHLTAAFTPIYRASRRAMAAMDAAYRDGWNGHIEAAWATILAMRGMALEDIGGAGEFVRPGNRERFYTAAWPNERCDLLTPGTVMAKPPLFRPGSTPNRLYHPVKPFRWLPELRTALWELRVWQGAKRRALLAGIRSLAGRAHLT